MNKWDGVCTHQWMHENIQKGHSCREYTHSPVERNFVTKPILDMSIQGVKTDIGNGTIHPFNRDRSLVYIEVEIQEFTMMLRLEKELLRNRFPKTFWIRYG